MPERCASCERLAATLARTQGTTYADELAAITAAAHTDTDTPLRRTPAGLNGALLDG